MLIATERTSSTSRPRWLDPTVLRDRYNSEMRGYIGVPEREDLTLELWIDIIQEAQSRP